MAVTSLIGVVRDLAWLRENAALRKDVSTTRWAVVKSYYPKVTVAIEYDDGTTSGPIQVSANAVSLLRPGQRVLVEQLGKRVTIIAAQVGGIRQADGSLWLVDPTAGGAGLWINGAGTTLTLTGARQGSEEQGAQGRLAFFGTGQTTWYGPQGEFINIQTDGRIDVNAAYGDLRLRGRDNAYLQATGGAASRVYIDSGPGSSDGVNIRTGATTRVIMGSSGGQGRMNINDIITTTSAANCHISTASSGWVYRSTSLRKDKASIEAAVVDADTYLSLEPKTWFDRTAAERMAAWLAGEVEVDDDGDDHGWMDSIQPLRRITGLVAEDVEKSGNEWLVERDDEGNLAGVAYDRGWVPLVPIVKQLRETIESQEQRITDLEAKVDRLMQLLEGDKK